MDTEKMNDISSMAEINDAAVCEMGEELSFCNCENDEVITPYEEDAEDILESDGESKKEMLIRKCMEAKQACAGTAARLVEDWQKTGGNPYIKQTHITQVDIYCSPDDEEPIDTFRTERVKSYSARSLAIFGAAAAVVVCTVDQIMKKILK